MFDGFQIRNVAIRPAHVLAPMAGITDTVFRRFIKRLGGCGLIMTEFVSSEGMIRQNFRSRRYLYYGEEERPITAQIFGADPAHLADAASQIEDLGFDLVDLNLGCPAARRKARARRGPRPCPGKRVKGVGSARRSVSVSDRLGA